MKITKLTLTIDQIMSLIAIDGYSRNVAIDALQDAVDDPDSVILENHPEFGPATRDLLETFVKRCDTLRRSRQKRIERAEQTKNRNTPGTIDAGNKVDETTEIITATSPEQAAKAAMGPAVRMEADELAQLKAFCNPVVNSREKISLVMFPVKFAPTDYNIDRLLWLKDNLYVTINTAISALCAQEGDDLGKNMGRLLSSYILHIDSYLHPLFEKAVELRDNPAIRPPFVTIPIFPGASFGQ